MGQYRMAVPDEYNGMVYVSIEGAGFFLKNELMPYPDALMQLTDLFNVRTDVEVAYVSTRPLSDTSLRELRERLDTQGARLDLPDPVIGWFGR